MRRTLCDVCGQQAVQTFEIYAHRAGYRALPFGLHDLRMQGRMVDLCEEHAAPIATLWVEAAEKQEAEA